MLCRAVLRAKEKAGRVSKDERVEAERVLERYLKEIQDGIR